MTYLIVCRDDEHGSRGKHGVRAAAVLVMHIPIEDIGDDLLRQMGMEPNLNSSSRDRFGETIERGERTLLGGRHEEVRCRIREVLVARPNHDQSMLGLPGHRVTERGPTDVLWYLTPPCGRSTRLMSS